MNGHQGESDWNDGCKYPGGESSHTSEGHLSFRCDKTPRSPGQKEADSGAGEGDQCCHFVGPGRKQTVAEKVHSDVCSGPDCQCCTEETSPEDELVQKGINPGRCSRVQVANDQLIGREEHQKGDANENNPTLQRGESPIQAAKDLDQWVACFALRISKVTASTCCKSSGEKSLPSTALQTTRARSSKSASCPSPSLKVCT